ncbi:hypothetical protein KR084_004762 [Drosophila pseudotakahashii]|nr:hypothetical protein KR084_004762 [Drosophila pseudotakahashii]
MDDNTENDDGKRVTRARTRRLSVLDTDSRPSTPLFDSAAERGTASPRATRRTRLNSSTLDVRTPTRPRRASLARGETPEPITPSSVKRTARTPAKNTRSVRQQLTLTEEPEEIEVKSSPSQSPVPKEGKLERKASATPSPVPKGAKLERKASATPSPVPKGAKLELKPSVSLITVPKAAKLERKPSASPSPVPRRAATPTQTSEEKRVTRSMSQTPPMVTRSSSNTPRELNSPLETESKPQEVEAAKAKITTRNTPKVAVRVEKLPMDRASAKKAEVAKQLILPEKVKEMESAEKAKKSEIKVSSETPKETDVSPAKDKQSFLKTFNTLAQIQASSKAFGTHSSEAETSKVEEKEIETPQKVLPAESPKVVKKIETPQKVKPIETTEIEEEAKSIDPAPKNVKKIETPQKITSAEAPAKIAKKIETPQKVEPIEVPEIEKEAETLQASPKIENKRETPQKVLSIELIDTSPEKDESMEDQEFLDAEESHIEAEPQEDEPMLENQEQEKINLDNDEPEVSMETPKADEVGKASGEVEAMEVEKPLKVDITEVICLPNLTPNIKSRVVGSPSAEQKKSVGFNDTDDLEVEKTRFPKTPGREKVPVYRTLTPKPETPLKPALQKGRNSSTPILKDQDRGLSISKAELQPAPPQIDAIKSFDELESKNTKDEVVLSAKKSKARLESSDEVEDEEDEEENEEDVTTPEFVDLEAEEAEEDYESGDSLDSSMRREMEENEIPHDGESVGSKDTEESTPEESEGDDSFIVSDNDVDEEEDVGQLCYFSDEDEIEEVPSEKPEKSSSKRRRIMVQSSSESEELEETHEESNKSKSEKPKNQSNCSSDASKLSEAAQLMNASEEKSLISETELERSRQVALNELNKSERFNKTETRLDVTVMEVDSSDHDEVEESQKARARSVYEIEDSDEVEELLDSDEKEECHIDGDSAIPKPTSYQAQKSCKSADEEALLAELASSDLRHLSTMFNPLQKSRRRSLYDASAELTAKEPKLRRRSDRANLASDFCPSQSFVEMEAERKRQKNKRKRLSKSLSGAPEDLEEMEIRHERKRLKSSHGDSTESFEEDHESAAVAEELASEGENSEGEVSDKIVASSSPPKTLMEESPEKAVALEEPSSEEPSTSQDPPPAVEVTKTVETAKATENLPGKKEKNAEFYLAYCQDLLEAANQAKLKEKKEQLATGARQKKPKRLATQAAPKLLVITSSNTEKANAKPSEEPPPLKKDIKRLQAARQAVIHAVNFLAPTKATNGEPRTLSRKLSPQPPVPEKKAAKQKKQAKKQKTPEISPVKSSDEENHGHGVNRIRTNAGYVTVVNERVQKVPKIELIKTSSGLVRVEPCSPKQKYFRELPPTPKLRGFREEPGPSGMSRKRSKHPATKTDDVGKHNPAKQSALRFKEQIFARKS